LNLQGETVRKRLAGFVNAIAAIGLSVLEMNSLLVARHHADVEWQNFLEKTFPASVSAN
jgi:hypothetical protein